MSDDQAGGVSIDPVLSSYLLLPAWALAENDLS